MTLPRSIIRRVAVVLLGLAGAALAQTPLNDPLRVNPRGLTELQPSTLAPGTTTTTPASGGPARVLPPSTLQPGQAGVPGAVNGRPAVPTPMTDPSLVTPLNAIDAAALLSGVQRIGEGPMPFGQQLFIGTALRTYGTGFNRDYVIASGDRVMLRMWGAFTLDATQVVDAQGNIFIPNVGPVRIAGVRNADLDAVVRAEVGRTYRRNVGVYAALEASQPVRVFVTGYVVAPGQYAGVAAEPMLGFLTRAGGVDPQRGSFIDIKLLRGGKPRASFDLYRFLLDGTLDPLQLQDGDTLVVGPRRSAATVRGEVFNEYSFEFSGQRIDAAELLRLARPKPGATHVSIVRKTGARQTGEYHPIDKLAGIPIEAGDELSVVADRSLGTILVRVDGANEGSRVLTLPYGAKLKEALARVQPSPQAQLGAIQLFRQSVARRQREMLEVSLHGLETYALTARSATSEEAALRTREAELIMRFVERARTVEPRGQVVLAGREAALDSPLEDGDVLYIPERSSMVMVHGEVTFPNAITYDSRSTTADYLRLAGGTTQEIDQARVLLVRRDGTFEEGLKARPNPGDEILVLPKVGTKSLEVTRSITSILYQLAVAARVVFRL